MHQREVVGVGGVFQLDLPVAGEAEAVFARHLDAVAGALFHEQVHPFFRRAKIVFQRLDIVLERGENHAGIAFGAQADQRQLGLVDAVAVAFRVRNAAQRSIQCVAPTVVGADEAVGLALLVFAHRGATVATAIEQHVYVFLAITHHNHRLLADVGGLVAAVVGYLAVVGDPDPGAVENLLKLGVEQLRVGVHRGVDAVGLHQVGGVYGEVYSGNQLAHGSVLVGIKYAG